MSSGKRQAHEAAVKRRPPIRKEIVDGIPCVWIPLTRGDWALVYESDYPLVSDVCWMSNGRYAVREKADGKLEFMHHRILNREPGKEAEHRSGNGFDNRRHMLRPATHQQNMCNQKTRTDNKSGFPGIHWDRNQSKWVAYINAKGKRTHLGSFTQKTKAIAIRSKAEKALHGEFSAERSRA